MGNDETGSPSGSEVLGNGERTPGCDFHGTPCRTLPAGGGIVGMPCQRYPKPRSDSCVCVCDAPCQRYQLRCTALTISVPRVRKALHPHPGPPPPLALVGCHLLLSHVVVVVGGRPAHLEGDIVEVATAS